MENRSQLINAAIDLYSREHTPSRPAATQHAGSDDSDSDATPKAKPIPLPQPTFGYSRNGNNSWKDLGLLEPVGANRMRGLPQPPSSQSVTVEIPFLDLHAVFQNKEDSDKSISHKKNVKFPVPTRRAPPPPARPSKLTAGANSSSHSIHADPSGLNLFQNQGGRSLQSNPGPEDGVDMENLNYLMLNLRPTDIKKVKSVPASARLPTN